MIIPFLKDNNIYFAGADLLGTKLSEINITSPTCLQEIHNNSDLNPAAIFWDNLKVQTNGAKRSQSSTDD